MFVVEKIQIYIMSTYFWIIGVLHYWNWIYIIGVLHYWNWIYIIGVFIIRRSLHAGYTNPNPNINPNLSPNPNHNRVKEVKKDYILGFRLFKYWAKDNEPTDHTAECSAFLNMH